MTVLSFIVISRDEISLATALYQPPVSFESKTSYDLRRIVEDQVRKNLK